jgi:hypothetical protein
VTVRINIPSIQIFYKKCPIHQIPRLKSDRRASRHWTSCNSRRARRQWKRCVSRHARRQWGALRQSPYTSLMDALHQSPCPSPIDELRQSPCPSPMETPSQSPRPARMHKPCQSRISKFDASWGGMGEPGQAAADQHDGSDAPREVIYLDEIKEPRKMSNI